MNEAFLRMTGFTREEELGKTWAEITPPEFHEVSCRAVEEVLTRGESTPYEEQYVRKEGSRWWGLFAARRIGKEVAEFVLDITKRRGDEERLRESEARFRTIVETARDHAVFGWSAEQAIGQRVDITFTPENRAECLPGKEKQEAGKRATPPTCAGICATTVPWCSSRA